MLKYFENKVFSFSTVIFLNLWNDYTCNPFKHSSYYNFVFILHACWIMSNSLQPYGLYVTWQTPLSMGFSRQEYSSWLPFPPPEDRPNPGIKPVSPALAGRFLTRQPPGKMPVRIAIIKKTEVKNISKDVEKRGTLAYCWWKCILI